VDSQAGAEALKSGDIFVIRANDAYGQLGTFTGLYQTYYDERHIQVPQFRIAGGNEDESTIYSGEYEKASALNRALFKLYDKPVDYIPLLSKIKPFAAIPYLFTTLGLGALCKGIAMLNELFEAGSNDIYLAPVKLTVRGLTLATTIMATLINTIILPFNIMAFLINTCVPLIEVSNDWGNELKSDIMDKSSGMPSMRQLVKYLFFIVLAAPVLLIHNMLTPQSWRTSPGDDDENILSRYLFPWTGIPLAFSILRQIIHSLKDMWDSKPNNDAIQAVAKESYSPLATTDAPLTPKAAFRNFCSIFFPFAVNHDKVDLNDRITEHCERQQAASADDSSSYNA
jgi:hypothetical protein